MRLTLMLAFTTFFCGVVLAQSVSIRTDEWFPMTGSPSGQQKGFMVDLAYRVFDSVDYKLMPWQRALEEVDAGNFDCVLGAYKEDAPGFIFPEESWGTDRIGIFIKQSDNWEYNGLESLLERKVGVIKGYSYAEDLDNLIESSPQVFKIASGINGLEKNIKKLHAGRIDVVIESTPVASAKLKSLGLSEKIKRVGFINEAAPFYIACSPANPKSKALVKKVDEITRQLREQGEIEKIMSQYGLTDWK